MSDLDQHHAGARRPDNENAQGPNLKLIYSLIALALAAAIAIAAMIVLPFYRHR
jgi:hypothetical protein